MLQNFISKRIKEQLPFEPNEEQLELLTQLGEFLISSDKEKIFLLKGYAGTGKTSIISALVRALNELKQKTVLLAPTGRAAKVISNYSGCPAYTIHKRIYRQKSKDEPEFQLSDNLNKHTLFIVDEASMISNSGGDSSFGTGYLLDDLIHFVYGNEGCSLLLLGDTAQLPPVFQSVSPALEKDVLTGYGLNVTEFTLTQVARQALDSGILFHATSLRELLINGDTNQFPKFNLKGFSDVRHINGTELIDEIQRSYSDVGIEETIVITRSNKRANIYNDGIRSRVLMKEEEFSNGDLIMVTRNNYFWNKPYKEIDFIANGDILEISRVRKYSEMYGFRFVDLSLHSLDYEWDIDARVWLDALNAESPAKMNELTRLLFERVSEDFFDIQNKRDKLKKIYENDFFNALQIKFSYAVTCHKAQGGQWKNVFIDIGQVAEEQVNDDFYRWLYTALTRATEKLFLINFPEKTFQ